MKDRSPLADGGVSLGPGPNFADITQGLFHRRGLKVHVSQHVNDLQTALSLVASEMGFTPGAGTGAQA